MNVVLFSTAPLTPPLFLGRVLHWQHTSSSLTTHTHLITSALRWGGQNLSLEEHFKMYAMHNCTLLAIHTRTHTHIYAHALVHAPHTRTCTHTLHDINQKITSLFMMTTSSAIGFFLTKIFHPNVSKTGEICVNTLKKDWKADLGLKHIFIVRIFLFSYLCLYACMFECARVAHAWSPCASTTCWCNYSENHVCLTDS